MSEYIERGEVLRLMRENEPMDGADAYRIVAWFPAADVEPVVRCRDCRYSGSAENGYEECLITDSIHQPDFYCALGKERER